MTKFKALIQLNYKNVHFYSRTTSNKGIFCIKTAGRTVWTVGWHHLESAQWCGGGFTAAGSEYEFPPVQPPDTNAKQGSAVMTFHPHHWNTKQNPADQKKTNTEDTSVWLKLPKIYPKYVPCANMEEAQFMTYGVDAGHQWIFFGWTHSLSLWVLLLICVHILFIQWTVDQVVPFSNVCTHIFLYIGNNIYSTARKYSEPNCCLLLHGSVDDRMSSLLCRSFVHET